jgi:hypothetical protein
VKQRISERAEFLNPQVEEIENDDEQLVRRLIGKVTVHDERFEIEFKSGMSVDVAR